MINFVIIMAFAAVGAVSVSRFTVTQGMRLHRIWKEVKAESSLAGMDPDEIEMIWKGIKAVGGTKSDEDM